MCHSREFGPTSFTAGVSWNAARFGYTTRAAQFLGCPRSLRPAFRRHGDQEADLALLQLLAAAEDAGVEIQNAFLGGTGAGATMGGASAGRAAVGRGSGLDALDYDSLDYDEFSQPDADGDHVISRMEVGASLSLRGGSWGRCLLPQRIVCILVYFASVEGCTSLEERLSRRRLRVDRDCKIREVEA